jgi:hypothetical protein
MQSAESQPTFPKNMSPSPASKNKQRKKELRVFLRA